MDSSVKTAQPAHPILDVLSQRWSPYCYDARPVEREKLLSCLEAARWAASSYNEQPWTFFLAERTDAMEFEKMLECLLEANQGWAKNAGVLMLSVVCPTFTRNGTPNRVAEHDLGLASAQLTVQAVSLGLQVHQMAGIQPAKIRQVYGIPDTHHPLTAIAIGYAGVPEDGIDKQLIARDEAPRSRKTISQFVCQGGWGKPFEA